MISSARVAIYGGPDVVASVVALGFEPVADGADIAVVDARDEESLPRAASLPPGTPRIFIIDAAQHGLIAALGVDPACVVERCEPTSLGPAITAALPERRRAPTRVIVVTSVRGGVGRTLLVTNLATRLAPKLRVCVVDGTGTGAAAWWLGREARPWSALEGLVEELSADQLRVLAEEIADGLRVVGGGSIAPSEALLLATTRTAKTLADLVIVDAPLAADRLTHASRSIADRTLLLAYDDPFSLAAVHALTRSDDLWLIASQSRRPRLGETDAFRALPRDEPAVALAMQKRGRVGGQLGRAYDDLAELLSIDAS
jgi:hypothetical protein